MMGGKGIIKIEDNSTLNPTAFVIFLHIKDIKPLKLENFKRCTIM